MAIKEIKECPKNKKIKLKGWRCRRCKYYNSKKWYVYGREFETFCTYKMTTTEKKYIT